MEWMTVGIGAPTGAREEEGRAGPKAKAEELHDAGVDPMVSLTSCAWPCPCFARARSSERGCTPMRQPPPGRSSVPMPGPFISGGRWKEGQIVLESISESRRIVVCGGRWGRCGALRHGRSVRSCAVSQRSIQQPINLVPVQTSSATCYVLRSNQSDKPHRVSSLNGLPFNT
jgi:hypothetical protein